MPFASGANLHSPSGTRSTEMRREGVSSERHKTVLRNRFRAASDDSAGRIRQRLSRVPLWVLLLVVGIWTVPTVGLFADSFRGISDQRRRGFWTVVTDPGQLNPDNYDTVLNRSSTETMVDALVSSFAIAIPATVLPVAFAALGAYAFVFIDFKGRDWFFIASVALLAVPVQMALIPLLSTFANGAHLTIPLTERTLTVVPDLNVNTRGAMAVWLTQTGFAIPFAIFLLHNAFTKVPVELIDAARIDGADHFTTFRRLVVPLTLPAFASLIILQFLWSWNDFLVARTMTSGGDPVNLPSAVRLANLAGEISSAGPVAAAGMFVQAAVPLLVFFGLQRHIARGISAGLVGD